MKIEINIKLKVPCIYKNDCSEQGEVFFDEMPFVKKYHLIKSNDYRNIIKDIMILEGIENISVENVAFLKRKNEGISDKEILNHIVGYLYQIEKIGFCSSD